MQMNFSMVGRSTSVVIDIEDTVKDVVCGSFARSIWGVSVKKGSCRYRDIGMHSGYDVLSVHSETSKIVIHAQVGALCKRRLKMI